jgi:hypothetical protein
MALRELRARLLGLAGVEQGSPLLEEGLGRNRVPLGKRRPRWQDH